MKQDRLDFLLKCCLKIFKKFGHKETDLKIKILNRKKPKHKLYVTVSGSGESAGFVIKILIFSKNSIWTVFYLSRDHYDTMIATIRFEPHDIATPIIKYNEFFTNSKIWCSKYAAMI